MPDVLIDPCDVLFFRDYKPFSGGEQSVAAVRFPPLPLPFVGALRTVMLEQLLDDKSRRLDHILDDPKVTNQVGGSDDPWPLSFTGPFLVSQNDEQSNLYLPCPADLLHGKDRLGEDLFFPLVPAQHSILPGVKTSKPEFILRAADSQGNAESSKGVLIDARMIESYLTGDSDFDQEMILPSEDVFRKEPRTGIALEPGKRTARQGMLYSADFVRLQKDYRLLMRVYSSADYIPLPEQGSIRLGGEGKFAFFRQCQSDELFAGLEDIGQEIIKEIQDTSRFKLCLMSPAIFRQGWLPDEVAPESFTMTINSQDFMLKGAAVSKAVLVGGWDLKKKRPRTLYRALPAGSVYFFEADEQISEETAQLVVDKYHLQSAMQPPAYPAQQEAIPPLYRAAGFGLSLVGVWNDE